MACLLMSLPIRTAFCNISNCRMMLTRRTADSAVPVLEAYSLPCSTDVPEGAVGFTEGSTTRK